MKYSSQIASRGIAKDVPVLNAHMSFEIGGPLLWNGLPNELRNIGTNEIFKKEILAYFSRD